MSFLKNILVLFALKVTFQNSVKISSPTENSNQIHTKYSTPTI